MLLEAALLFAFGLFLLLLNGFFVLAEFAVVKVRSSRIEELVQSSDYVADRLRDAVTPEQVVEILVAGEQATLG